MPHSIAQASMANPLPVSIVGLRPKHLNFYGEWWLDGGRLAVVRNAGGEGGSSCCYWHAGKASGLWKLVSVKKWGKTKNFKKYILKSGLKSLLRETLKVIWFVVLTHLINHDTVTHIQIIVTPTFARLCWTPREVTLCENEESRVTSHVQGVARELSTHSLEEREY